MKLIKTCDSIYGSISCIYRYVNPAQIVEVHIEHTQRTVAVEALLTSGQKVIILKEEDLENLVGETSAKEIREKIEEFKNEYRNK